MTKQEKSVLGAQPFLRGLPDRHLEKLAALCRHVAAPSGRRLFDEDAGAGRFWLIDAGQVVIDTTVPGGRYRHRGAQAGRHPTPG